MARNSSRPGPSRPHAAWRLASGLLASALALAGCSDDATVADGEAGESLGGDTDELPADLGGPAVGIRIVRVEVNQGVGVELVRDGEPVPLEQRSATPIRDRDTLVRLDHELVDPDAWVARELVGVLHIQPPDGPERIRTRTLLIDADSEPRQLTSGFYFSLLAEEARPGTAIWIELREADASFDAAALPPGAPNTPLLDVGLSEASLALRVVLVPVRYEHLDPPREPDIDAADLAMFHDYLLQQNPVQTVELSVREQPIVRAEALTNLGSLLGPTREAKLADAAPANVYYHALVDVGGPSVSQVAGIALLTDASKEASPDRVAATVYYKRIVEPDEDAEDQTPTVYPPSSSARTFVHEVGHNQGLPHIACPNANAANPDLEYPHADGKIGVFGFGIRDFHLYTPSAAHDYMTYCGNSWVSDWTWTKTLARIETLTSWDFEAPGVGLEGLEAGAQAGPQPVLVGILGADGFEEWSLSLGRAPALDPAATSETLEVGYVRGDRVERVRARIDRLSDDATVMVTAPLPGFDQTDGLTAIHWLDPRGEAHDIDLDRLQLHR